MSDELPIKFGVREEWLNNAATLLNQMIFKFESEDLPGLYGKDLGDLKISCGFPLGSRGSAKKLGQCLSASTSESGMTEIYISPTVSDPTTVLGILHHEMLHYMVGVSNGHDSEFKRGMRMTGLQGKPTSTYPTHYTIETYKEIINLIGGYPHSKVTIPERGSVGSNLLKIYCKDCGYTARTTQKWLDLSGPAICPKHNTRMCVEVKS